jgi:hypothetical protein
LKREKLRRKWVFLLFGAGEKLKRERKERPNFNFLVSSLDSEENEERAS